MERRKWMVAALVLLLALGVSLAAGAQGRSLDLGGQKLGLIFNIWDMQLGTSSVSANDGLSAGVGLKYWLGDKTALRALLGFNHNSDSDLDTSQTIFGLSGAFEYHFKTGRVSPYTGALVGLQIETGDNSNLGLILGGLLGVEVRVMDALGLFAEYALSMYMDEPVFAVQLGIANNAAIGVVVYLP